MTDAPAVLRGPVNLMAVRAALEHSLEEAVATLHDSDSVAQVLERAQIARALAAALIDVDQVVIVRNSQAPPLDVSTLISVAWHATQDAGAPTAVGDAVAVALREAMTS